ncbi:hypothetical protein [Brachyspira sp.]|uniref:hypothetical protein n=1 Tax=Brachyspira sp. TaxID=1977261 RepID=UPI003D7DE275
MYNFKKIFTYLVVGALVMALSISCKSNEAPGSGGGDLGSIPTATGNPATVGDVTFAGTLNRTVLSGISEQEAESGTAPATLKVPDDFQLEITGSKVNAGIIGTLQGIQLLYNSDAKVVEASGELTDSGIKVKEYIKITLDDAANPTTATVIYQMGSSGNGINMLATYEGTLNKQ